jgi:uncharacterized protein YegL
MAGEPINELNEGVRHFFMALKADPIASVSAEVAIIAFHSQAELVLDFESLERVNEVPVLEPKGMTDLGGGVLDSLACLQQRKDEYQSAGVEYFQPWLVLMTDGAPTTLTHGNASKAVLQLEGQGKLTVFPIGIGDQADMRVLSTFSKKKSPLRLRGLNFSGFFEWLSQSVVRVSQSMPGESVKIDTDGIQGWGEL